MKERRKSRRFNYPCNTTLFLDSGKTEKAVSTKNVSPNGFRLF